MQKLISGDWPAGRVRVLYVSPLKALNNDVQRNLLQPLTALRACFEAAGEPFPQIGVLTLSGDTPPNERWQMLRPDARIATELPPDHRHFTPPDGLEQAILNVLNNAADASPDVVELSAATEGDVLFIDVADRGPGFTAEQKAQAGRVLFSGKPGRGWGMGLALTHATLERLGGNLTLTERDGGGTRVRITLPWKQAA